MSEYLTPAQAADLLHVSSRTVYEWVKSGKLPSFRAGARRILISPSHIDQFLSRTSSAAPPSSTALASSSPMKNHKRNGQR